MNGRTWLKPQRPRKMRYALEVRHESFRDVEFVALLRHHGVAVVVADTAGRWPVMEDVTADFVYVRLHGDEAIYTSGYGGPALLDWAKRVTAWRRGSQVVDARTAATALPPKRLCRDVFCYFDNDVKVHAPFDAMRLDEIVGDLEASTLAKPAAPRPRKHVSRRIGLPRASSSL